MLVVACRAWATLCNTTFTGTEAAVACRSAGLPTDFARPAYFGPGRDLVAAVPMMAATCLNGNESSLADCLVAKAAGFGQEYSAGGRLQVCAMSEALDLVYTSPQVVPW